MCKARFIPKLEKGFDGRMLDLGCYMERGSPELGLDQC